VSVDLLFPAAPDPIRPLRLGSLCTGYGGLDLGVRAVLGGELVFTADPDRHLRAVLAARFLGVPNLGDITPADFGLPDSDPAGLKGGDAATNAQIRPSLGRDLAACRGAATCSATATVPLIAPQTMFDDRLTRLDLRIGKRIMLSQRMRLQANVNVYNVFNGSASSVLNVNYGPLWLQPSLLQDGRMLQFSGNLTF